MTSAPEVTVILPLYRNFQWLPEALNSLLNSRFERWEAVLVDDGSPADPRPILEPFLKDPRFRYFKKEHEGIAASRNFGLRHARGEWIAFLDQDDRILPDRFANQMNFVRGRGESLAGVYSDYERIDESGRILDRYASRAAAPERFIRENLGEKGLVAIGTVLMRKAWIDRAGGFDPDLSGYDEGDLVLRIALLGGIFSYLPGTAHQWRNHPENTMKSPEFQAERRLKFLSKLERLSVEQEVLREILPDFRARTWYKLGLHHAESGRWEEARKWCWKAWKENPKHGSALYLAGKALCRVYARSKNDPS